LKNWIKISEFFFFLFKYLRFLKKILEIIGGGVKTYMHKTPPFQPSPCTLSLCPYPISSDGHRKCHRRNVDELIDCYRASSLSSFSCPLHLKIFQKVRPHLSSSNYKQISLQERDISSRHAYWLYPSRYWNLIIYKNLINYFQVLFCRIIKLTHQSSIIRTYAHKFTRAASTQASWSDQEVCTY